MRPSSISQPTLWAIEVDEIGAFQCAGFSDCSREGNYRILTNDVLNIFLPAGSLVNQDDVKLVIEDALGVRVTLPGSPDHYGALSFQWVAPEASAGPVNLTFEYTPYSKAHNSKRRRGVENTVIVEPRIHINGAEVDPSSLSMQTVMSRCLGRLDTWCDRIKYATADLGYNVVHFTPVQTPGESGSCYSLADQLAIAPNLLPEGFQEKNPEDGPKLLREVVLELEHKHGVLSTSDIVLNHTANDTHWLPKHPESGYNVRNSPHLRAAIDLDIALQELSVKISGGRYRHQGVPESIENEETLANLKRLVNDAVLKPFKMHEWFQMDVELVVQNCQEAFHSTSALPSTSPDLTVAEAATIKRPQSYEDLINAVVKECLRTVGVRRHNGIRPRPSVMVKLCREEQELHAVLKECQTILNSKAIETHDNVLNAVEGYVRWERLRCRKGPIGHSHWDALVPRYFTPVNLPDGEVLHLANNGWVMGWNAEEDFAAPGSIVYLNRSLIAWSDCVKLRYGEKPSDCPFLWNLMGEYCRTCASIFHGIRLDNCHSTPIHVAKYCLNECRKINPKLWVYAELFTGNRDTDLRFERELGLNALIREALQSYSSQNLCYHIEEFGGDPLGTLEPVLSISRLADDNTVSMRPLYPTLGKSLFFDCTHDNETPQQKRTAVDALPNAAAVAASVCSIGSCRGYDELVPKVLSVVTESRLYHHYGPPIESCDTTTSGNVANRKKQEEDLITDARIYTSLRAESSRLVAKGSWDGWKNDLPLSRRRGVWTGELSKEYVPSDPDAYREYQYKFVADGNNWFHDPQLPSIRDNKGNVNNLLIIGKNPNKGLRSALTDCHQWSLGKTLPGIMEARKILNDIHRRLGSEGFTECEARNYGDNIITITRHQPSTHRFCIFFIHTAFSPGVLADPGHVDVTHEIRGKIDEVLLEARLVVPEDVAFNDEIHLINGLPSYLHLAGRAKGVSSRLGGFETRYDEASDQTFLTLTSFPPGSALVVITEGFRHVRETVTNAIQDIGSIPQGVPGAKISRADELQAFSYLLYSCSIEERDRSRGARGCYELGEGVGELPYAGIAGSIPILDKLRNEKTLNHALARNILSGDWFFEYLADRLDTDRDDAFTGGVVVVLLKVATWLRETFREPLRYLPRQLLTYYFDWIVSSIYSWIAKRVLSGLPEPLKSTTDPFILRLCLATLQFYSFVPSAPLISGTQHASLSAGLPHFSTGFMRNWGRDTFIAIKGCLLVTGRFQEARDEIMAYACVMRHGLIPNLQDSGNNPRYNARDATWFFLLAVHDYCQMAPEGTEFLKAAISLKYTDALPNDVQINSIADLIHFILSSHAKGIEFREWNAGPKIDSCMRDEGFNVKITFDSTTGFVYGGNKYNCGTWMDKMGSSKEAGTLGVPATPRDGAAIEIIGIMKNVLRFVTSLPSSVFPYDVANESLGLTYKTWHNMLQQNIDSLFFVTDDERRTSNAKRSNIYKDTFKSSDTWRDYQLRPNLCIALAVAPEAFVKEHSLACLDQVGKYLLGLKTSEELEALIDMARQTAGNNAIDVVHWFKNHLSIKPLFSSQLGLKTLDPEDSNYRPVYDNDNRSRDPSMADGFSYHNGPEWVWPLGHYLEAKFFFERGAASGNANIDHTNLSGITKASNANTSTNNPTAATLSNNGSNTMNNNNTASAVSSPTSNDGEEHTTATNIARFSTMQCLLVHRQFMAKDRWLSLPEITNSNAEFCKYGCPAQAWSVGTILAFLTTIATTAPPPMMTSNTLRKTGSESVCTGDSNSSSAGQPSTATTTDTTNMKSLYSVSTKGATLNSNNSSTEGSSKTTLHPGNTIDNKLKTSSSDKKAL